MGAFLYLFMGKSEKEMQRMYRKRTLKQLVDEKGDVIIYLRNDEVCRRFFREAQREGFRFGKLPYSEWVTGTLIGIHRDGSMGHEPYFVYSLLHLDKTEIVDYFKYESNEESYYYSDSDRR